MTHAAAWVKNGEYRSVIDAFQHGRRTAGVSYAHNVPNKCIDIKHVELFSEHKHELIVNVKIGNGAKQFADYMSRHGFPVKDISFETTNDYYLHIPNAQFLADFLNVLKDADPDVCLFADDMINSIKPYLKAETIPGWIKSGSFENHPYVDFDNRIYDANISRLALEETLNPGQLRLYVNTKNSAQAIHALRAAGITLSRHTNELHSCIIESQQELAKALHALTTIEPSIADVRDNMMASAASKLKYAAPAQTIIEFGFFVRISKQPDFACSETPVNTPRNI